MAARVKRVIRKVLAVRQSPLNERRWLLTLDCGHDEWVTSGSRPKRKTWHCMKCDKGAAAAV